MPIGRCGAGFRFDLCPTCSTPPRTNWFPFSADSRAATDRFPRSRPLPLPPSFAFFDSPLRDHSGSSPCRLSARFARPNVSGSIIGVAIPPPAICRSTPSSSSRSRRQDLKVTRTCADVNINPIPPSWVAVSLFRTTTIPKSLSPKMDALATPATHSSPSSTKTIVVLGAAYAGMCPYVPRGDPHLHTLPRSSCDPASHRVAAFGMASRRHRTEYVRPLA